ncbi:MAG: class I SAM-dependent RNA methyltransferase [Bacteriovoracaceae bacterium]
MQNTTPNTPSENLTCTIDYVDNLGQGVDKKQSKITLIPKTLPGEVVEISTKNEQSKVRFGKLEKIVEASDVREKPICRHFNDCPGCHYLHTNYKQEVLLKKSHAEHLFKKYLTDVPMNFIQAPDRLGYRNRIQLHYSKKEKKLGFIRQGEGILQVPECQIIQPNMKLKLKELYQNGAWEKLVEKEKDTGHIEIYAKGRKTEVNINRPYAEGGFSQVNEAMNLLLVDKITQAYQDHHKVGPILDLFGGNGNLTQNLTREDKVLCVDTYQTLPNPIGPKTFYSLDLFNNDALKNFKKSHPKPFPNLILDPPRSGFKDIREWSDALKVQTIIYVSCHPQTQVRDLETLIGPFKVKEISIFDLFPSTFHFESVVVLSRV